MKYFELSIHFFKFVELFFDACYTSKRLNNWRRNNLNRLKELRIQKGLLQQDIASYLSVANSTYSYWESGKIEVNNENLFRLADFFNVTTDYLLGRSDNPTPNEKDSSRELSDSDLKFALFGDGDITDAKFDEVKRFAKWVMEREKDDGNGKAT